MQNFPVPKRSLLGFQNFPSPSKLRWGFPDFRSSVIQKRGDISNWLGTWAYRIPFAIDSSKIDSDLTHFPVPIVLTGTDAEAVITELGSNSKKIAVGLPDKSQLYCEIEQWFFAVDESDVTDSSFTIGDENPTYIGKAWDDVLTDPNATGSWYAYYGNYQNTGWVGQNFGSGNEKTIKKYRIYNDNANTSPRSWTFEASTTGDWTGEEVVLDTQTNYDFDASLAWHDFDVSNDTAYQYYRINVTLNNGHVTYLVVREIEFCEINYTCKITLWVSRSDWIISSSEDTILFLYYDSTQDDNTTYVGDPGDTAAQNVWNSNFVARYGMAQDPSGGTDCIIDSTANANHGTPYGSMTSDDLVDGEIGKAIDFDGIDDVIEITGAGLNNLAADDFTILYSFVSNAPDDDARQLFSKRSDSGDLPGITNFHERRDDREDETVQASCDFGAAQTNLNGPITLSTFYRVAHVRSGTLISLYVNGSLIESDDSAGNDADISDTITLKIGSNRTKDDSFFQGQQSDYIISDSVGFSADWIKADYYAQTNTLLTTGTPQEYNG
jgi:hypothetical protein